MAKLLLKVTNICKILKSAGITFVVLFLFFGSLSAQDTTLVIPADTAKKIHSPQRATLMSAAFPGLGQIYNRKYWKPPIVYTGFGVVVYFIDFNNNQFNRFKTAYLYRTDNDPATIDEFADYPNVTDNSIKGAMDTYRRWRDMNIIGLAALYVLQIVDASVDAYLYNYDVSPDLSVHIAPSLQPVDPYLGYVPTLKLIIELD